MVRLVANEDSANGARYLMSIDPRYHSDERDQDDLIAATQWTRSILSSESFGSMLGEELLPGSKRQSEDQLASSISRFATTIYHYVGTCAMGSPDTGVVDSRFRVHGVDGLWVCDASAIPNVTSGNPQATVMMMAYRLANWLT
jgi:choline dehydrogenase